jgi:hypothetical protein
MVHLAACGGLVWPEDSASDAGVAQPDPVEAGVVDALLLDAGAAPSFGGADVYIDPGVPCGTFDKIPTICNVSAGKVCCVKFRDSLVAAFGDDMNRCEAPAACTSGLAVECNGSGDCAASGKPGTVCCVHYANAAFPETLRSITCVPYAECAKERHLVLCDSKAPVPCPNGTKCTPVLTNPFIEACR